MRVAQRTTPIYHAAMIDLTRASFPVRSGEEVVLEIDGYVTVQARCWGYISSELLAPYKEAST